MVYSGNPELMERPFTIQPIYNSHQKKILDLILPIQQIEFSLSVTLEDQPDLLDIESYYHRTGGCFWGAEYEGELIGTIALITNGHNAGTIRKMFIKKEFRGKETGLAQCLLEVLINYCRGGGITDLYLGTIDVLRAAHRFYERNGFLRTNSEDMPAYFFRMRGENVYYRLHLS